MRRVVPFLLLQMLIGYSTGLAEDGNVPLSTLGSLGLGDLQQMSPSEGMQVRGRLTVSGSAIGFSVINVQLASPDPNPIVNTWRSVGMDSTTTPGVTINAGTSIMGDSLTVPAVGYVASFSNITIVNFATFWSL